MDQRDLRTIEILFAGAFAMFLVLGLISFYVEFAKAIRTQNQTNEFNQLATSIDSALRFSDTCSFALSGQPYIASPGARTDVTFRDPRGSLKAGEKAGSLSVTQVRLEHVASVPMAINEHMANLQISVDKTGNIIGNRHLHQTFRLKLAVKAGVVTSCSTFNDLSLPQICSAFDGAFNIQTQKCAGVR